MNAAYAFRAPTKETLAIDTYFMNVLVVATFLYTELFNYFDEGSRTAAAGVLGIAVTVRCVLSWSRPFAQLATFLFLSFLFILGFYFIFMMDPVLRDAVEYISRTVRLMTCLAVFLVFALGPRVVSPALLTATCSVMVVTAAAVALTGEPANLAGILRPATFTGGDEGVHSTGYALAAAFLGVITLWRSGWLGMSRAMVLAGPLLVLIFLLQVRTTWVMCLAYAAATALMYLKTRKGRPIYLAMIAFLAAAALVLSVMEKDVDYAEFSSGRTAAYTERLEMIIDRPAMNILIGTGPGSEMLTSSVWWWAAKNSHNDFLDVTIQTGVVGLAITTVLLWIAMSQMDRVQLPLFIAFITSSLISNGLLGRPFLAAILLSFISLPMRRDLATIRPAERSRRTPVIR